MSNWDHHLTVCGMAEYQLCTSYIWPYSTLPCHTSWLRLKTHFKICGVIKFIAAIITEYSQLLNWWYNCNSWLYIKFYSIEHTFLLLDVKWMLYLWWIDDLLLRYHNRNYLNLLVCLFIISLLIWYWIAIHFDIILYKSKLYLVCLIYRCSTSF